MVELPVSRCGAAPSTLRASSDADKSSGSKVIGSGLGFRI